MSSDLFLDFHLTRINWKLLIKIKLIRSRSSPRDSSIITLLRTVPWSTESQNQEAGQEGQEARQEEQGVRQEEQEARQEEQGVRKEGQEEGAEEDRDLNRVEVADDKEEVERGLGRPVQVAGVPGGRLRPAWPPVRTLTM